MRRWAMLLSVVVTVALAGCGDKDSYEAAEGGLRAWLTAVHAGDAEASDVMTAEYSDELAADEAAFAELPPADSEMTVAAWDPSGEALVEVTRDGEVAGFWMVFQDGRWLVAGRAP